MFCFADRVHSWGVFLTVNVLHMDFFDETLRSMNDLFSLIIDSNRDKVFSYQIRSQTESLQLEGFTISRKQWDPMAEEEAFLTGQGRQDLEKAELRRQDISKLKNLFCRSGFVNYVSTIYLQNLCKAANERFYKLTRQKLGIELSEENSFEVREYMNDSHLRNVKTLSGGQTFQASLSLALSLADSIHKLAASSENFFFLDEGFGTLDKETLEVAFDPLKSLRKEKSNRRCHFAR